MKDRRANTHKTFGNVLETFFSDHTVIFVFLPYDFPLDILFRILENAGSMNTYVYGNKVVSRLQSAEAFSVAD